MHSPSSQQTILWTLFALVNGKYGPPGFPNLLKIFIEINRATMRPYSILFRLSDQFLYCTEPSYLHCVKCTFILSLSASASPNSHQRAPICICIFSMPQISARSSSMWFMVHRTGSSCPLQHERGFENGYHFGPNSPSSLVWCFPQKHKAFKTVIWYK